MATKNKNKDKGENNNNETKQSTRVLSIALYISRLAFGLQWSMNKGFGIIESIELRVK